MKLLTAALFIALLTTTSAKPIRQQRHHDADIPDSNMRQGWQDEVIRWVSRSTDSSNYRDSSSESEQPSESSDSHDSDESSDSSESSEETTASTTSAAVTTASTTSAAVTTASTTSAAVTTASTTSAAVTIVTSGDGSTLTPEPKTVGTDGPVVTETTPQAGTLSTPFATSTTNVTHRVTVEIPTAAPITESRGDN